MTKTTLAALAALALAACGSEAPPPKPTAKASAPVEQKAAPAPQAAAAPAPQPQPRAVEAPSNANPNDLLAQRVKKALEDASLHAAGVDVTASSGVVSLFGTVDSAEEQRRAATIAARVDGVKSVENKLVVVRGS